MTRTPTATQLSSSGVRQLTHAAAEARAQGFDLRAADLYHEAAGAARSVDERLHLSMREVYCRLAVGDRTGAEKIAAEVASEARTQECYGELADALGVRVEVLMLRERPAEAHEVLSEAMYAMQRVPDDPAFCNVVHNMAVTYQRCDFPLQAIELYERALRLASTDSDRSFIFANLASAYHLAMTHASDPAEAGKHLHDGIYAATAALDVTKDRDVASEATALAHRSVLLNAIGHHEAALVDAERCRELAKVHALEAEEVVAMVGEAVARWHLHRDTSVLDLIGEAAERARSLKVEAYLRSTARVSIDILWEQGHYDDARAVMNSQLDGLTHLLQRERLMRWDHVRLGVSLKCTEAISEADPLTGLPNRRYLEHWLPKVLEHHAPVAVALLDLDGFKQVNDDHSYEQGDTLLQELASLLQRICRRGDAVVRLGGDEFLIVLRHTSAGDARTVLERVRQLIANRNWQELPEHIRLSASIGVAVGSGGDDAQRVLAAAGDALHVAKREGRDRIVFR